MPRRIVGPGFLGALDKQQRAPEREIADAVGRLEAGPADLALVGQELAAEAGIGPRRGHAPCRVPSTRCEGEAAVAAQHIIEIDRELRWIQLGQIHRRVETGADEACSPARSERELRAVGADVGSARQPARIGHAEADFGAVELYAAGLHPELSKVRRQLEHRAALSLRAVDYDIVNRARAAFGEDVRRRIDPARRKDQTAIDRCGAGDGLAAHLFGGVDGLLERDRQFGPGNDLRPAPAGRDRSARSLRLRLAVVNQQPNAENRNGEKKADQKGTEKLAARTSQNHATAS